MTICDFSARPRLCSGSVTHEGFNWKQDTWNKDYSLFFVILKEAIANSLSLFFPDYTLPWVLRTDASEAGVGAVLLQVATDESGNEVYQPLGFTSQKFSDPATRWATIEQEAYGIYAAVKSFSYYLYVWH